MQIKRNHINFAVGPVLISDEISALGKEPVPYFRTPEFSAVMKENEAIFLELLHAEPDSRAVFLTGSGTAAMDAVVQNLFTKNDHLLIVNGGSFGQRFCDIAAAYGIPFEEIQPEFGCDLSEEILAPFDSKGYTGFLVNMHETSTGVLYNMGLISRFCKKNHLSLVVDAISSFLADDLNMQQFGADAVITGSQKALALPPGISLIALSASAVNRVNSNTPTCYYLDLKSMLKNGERGQTPFTPAVGILLQLNSRLNQIKETGIAAEQNRIASLALDFRDRIKMYPFRIVSNSLSNALTPLSPTNSATSAMEIFEVLKNDYNIIVCPNGGDLADTVFRVGHIGSLSVLDNDALFLAFDALIERGIIKK